MASSATFTTIVIVVLAFVTYSEQRAFQRYSKYLEKAVPNHWHHDKEELGRRVDKISRWHQVERVPPLQPQEASWDRLAREGRVAAFDKNQDKEQQRVRRRLLEEKLKLNHISRKVMVHPQMKRQVEVKSVEKLRTKREILDEKSNKQLEIQPLEGIRHKRDIILNPQIQPEVMLQSHIQTPMQQETEAQYQERVKQNRDKRQIMYLMNQPPIFINLAPRTTPNPFIRETHVDEYQAIESNPPVKSDSYDDSSIMRESQNVLFEITRKLLSLESWLLTPQWQVGNSSRVKRSPKMSKLHKKQKLAKKKRKKKKQQKPSPRQIKHFRRIRESREERRRILHKKLKEKRRIRHKKMGTGPYNKTIIDYYGVYFDPPSSQLNESLYDSIYDSSALDSDKIYDEQMKDHPDFRKEGEEEYEDSEDEESEEEESEGELSDKEGSMTNCRGDDEMDKTTSHKGHKENEGKQKNNKTENINEMKKTNNERKNMNEFKKTNNETKNNDGTKRNTSNSKKS